MRIGIDARLLEETGVGRYIRNLIAELAVHDTTNAYVVFLRKHSFASFRLPNARWTKVLADVRWHTLTEQLVMPGVFRRQHLDLVHIPYHNPPIFYSGPIIVTIHDLTILHFNTGKATTLPLPFYELKRLGYWFELCIGLRKAKQIIAVSEATKKEIMDHFHVPAQKISVTYEGIDTHLASRGKRSSGRLVKDPYFLYVGNAYPHKNLETLLEAFNLFRARSPVSDIKLVLVGNDDFFYRQVRHTVTESGLSESVIFFGPANDSELIDLYQYTLALVFPSLMEGFGLPALEALSLGSRVLASDIPIFHEILGPFAMYFDARTPESIAEVLRAAYGANGNGTRVSAELQKFLATYSWARMAGETLKLYERSTRI